MVIFEHPGFLWCMALVTVPVVLHLLNLRHPRKVVFPSVRFLRKSRQPQEGRRRLRDLLQLLLRMILIALASLLLAGPRWQQPVAADGGRRLAMIVMDDSASMGWNGRMERAVETARRIHDELAGWEVGLVSLTATADGVAEFLPPTAEGWRFDEALAACSASWLSPTPQEAIRLAVDAMKDGRQRRLVVIGDFQTTTWGHRLNLVPDDVELQLHDVREEGQGGNCGVAAVHCMRLGSRRLRVVTTLMNTSMHEQTRELDVEIGVERRRERLMVSPQGRTRVAMLFDNVELGQRGVARLSSDVYPKDDVRLFWGDGASPRNVLICVSGGHDSVAPQECEFVTRALESEVDGGGRRFVTEIQETSLVSAEDVSKAQAVFLLGGATMVQEDAAKALKEFVEKGGCVFMTPSRQPGGDVARMADFGVDIGRFQGFDSQVEGGRVDGVSKVKEGSALALLYADVYESDLYTFAIRRCCRIRPVTSSTVLMESLEGLPLLLEGAFGAGRCYVMAFGFADWWGDFQLTNSFLPMLHELLENTLDSDVGHRRVTCGTHLESREDGLPMDTSEPSLLLDGTRYVEVNVDVRESQETTVGELDMRELLRRSSSAEQAMAPKDARLDLQGILTLLTAFAVMLELVFAIGARRSV